MSVSINIDIKHQSSKLECKDHAHPTSSRHCSLAIVSVTFVWLVQKQMNMAQILAYKRICHNITWSEICLRLLSTMWPCIALSTLLMRQDWVPKCKIFHSCSCDNYSFSEKHSILHRHSTQSCETQAASTWPSPSSSSSCTHAILIYDVWSVYCLVPLTVQFALGWRAPLGFSHQLFNGFASLCLDMSCMSSRNCCEAAMMCFSMYSLLFSSASSRK